MQPFHEANRHDISRTDQSGHFRKCLCYMSRRQSSVFKTDLPLEDPLWIQIDSRLFECSPVTLKPLLHDAVFLNMSAEKTDSAMTLSNQIGSRQITSLFIINPYIVKVLCFTVTIN